MQHEEYGQDRKADLPLTGNATLRVDDPRRLGHERHAVKGQPQQKAREHDHAKLRGRPHADKAIANPSTSCDPTAGFEQVAKRKELPHRHRRQYREADEQRRDAEAPFRHRSHERN